MMIENILHNHFSQSDNIMVERDVLSLADSPWLVKLLYSFQDPQHVYLAMVDYFFFYPLFSFSL